MEILSTHSENMFPGMFWHVFEPEPTIAREPVRRGMGECGHPGYIHDIGTDFIGPEYGGGYKGIGVGCVGVWVCACVGV